jgi:hypothetical protein
MKSKRKLRIIALAAVILEVAGWLFARRVSRDAAIPLSV